MPRYKIQSIAERGGLKVYLTSIGVDYDLFKKLRDLYPDKWSTIANGLSKGLKEPLKPGRIKSWCQVDNGEMEAAKNAKG